MTRKPSARKRGAGFSCLFDASGKRQLPMETFDSLKPRSNRPEGNPPLGCEPGTEFYHDLLSDLAREGLGLPNEELKNG